MIAPMVAARNKNIAFIISMAGSFSGGIELSTFQNAYALSQAKVKEKHIQSYLKLHRSLLHAIVASNDTIDFRPRFDSILNHWKKHESTVYARKYAMGNAAARRRTWNSYKAFFNPWWKFYLTYDPRNDLASIHCPVLAINGSKDVQVPCGPNLDIVKQTVKSDSLETRCIPGLNHLFQECKECTVAEYFTLEQTLSPVAIGLMAAWLKQQVIMH
jgi:pimeloyl-ACP methyl ester carboxylesterase